MASYGYAALSISVNLSITYNVLVHPITAFVAV